MKLSRHKKLDTQEQQYLYYCNKATCTCTAKIQCMYTIIIASLTIISRICPLYAVNQILFATTLFRDSPKINWFAAIICVIHICVVIKTNQQGLVCIKILVHK